MATTRGWGQSGVTRYLDGVGMPRPTAYRWKQEMYHDLKAFGRGTVRAGATPAGIALPTDDWLELLDLAADAPPTASNRNLTVPLPATIGFMYKGLL